MLKPRCPKEVRDQLASVMNAAWDGDIAKMNIPGRVPSVD
jgi:hypothetical protein